MSNQSQQQPRSRLWLALPLIFFAGLTAMFLVGLRSGDPSKLPSALIGKPAPELNLPALEGLQANGVQIPGLSQAGLNNGKVNVLNVWASWCGPCRQEHPQLMELAKRKDINLVGLNYKDQRANAVRFLVSLGNPYSHVGVDTTGRAAVDWGVYGVPETFVVSPGGTIIYKFTGPLTPQAMQNELLPAIQQAAQ